MLKIDIRDTQTWFTDDLILFFWKCSSSVNFVSLSLKFTVEILVNIGPGPWGISRWNPSTLFTVCNLHMFEKVYVFIPTNFKTYSCLEVKIHTLFISYKDIYLPLMQKVCCNSVVSIYGFQFSFKWKGVLADTLN